MMMPLFSLTLEDISMCESKRFGNIRMLLLQMRSHQHDADEEYTVFRSAMQLEPEQLLPVNVALEKPKAEEHLTGIHGVVIAGSPFSALNSHPHIVDLHAILHRARLQGIPMFGVCFGAQFLALHLGGTVVPNGGRAEHGTVEVTLAPDAENDPCFSGLPLSFHVQHSHFDHIERLPRGARLLAINPRCTVQAFSLDGKIFGTQFHPERTHDYCLEHLTRKAQVDDYYREHEPRIRRTIRPSPEAHSILVRFIERVVQPRA